MTAPRRSSPGDVSRAAQGGLGPTSVDERVRTLQSAGDTSAAATAAFEALGPAIFALLRTLHAEDDAADVFQDWAEDMCAGLPGFRGECTVRTWAYRLAWHASARFHRGAWNRRRTRLRTGMMSRLAASIARTAVPGRRDERLEVLLRDLGPEDRMLLLLRLEADLTWEEISEVLRRRGKNVALPALRKRFERLKARLAEIAREKGLLE